MTTPPPPPAAGPILDREAAAGLALIAAAVLAMIVANGPAAGAYAALLDTAIGASLAPGHGVMTVHRWIDDGLMAVFFLVVGLEIKRAFVEGALADPAQRRLPFVAAAAGMIVPALVYLAIAGGEPALRRGWAIPAATDIAFAIGVLALLGPRVPPALKLLLTTIAIVDDVGAIAIIAFGYTDTIRLAALAGAIAVVLSLYACNRRGVVALWPYLGGFALLWTLVMASGIHATIAGVVTAMLVPARRADGGTDAPLHRLEHRLRPWVAFAIVPLFGFANAGVDLAGAAPARLAGPLVPAIALGLFAGKQAGIFGAIWLADRTGLAPRPAGVGWRQLYGMALIAGIGFTMSLFIGGLAFPGDAALRDTVRIGVLSGSILSALAGVIVLLTIPPPAAKPR